MKELQGKVAVITGAAEGIGRAIAEQAAARGMKLVLADISAAKLDEAEAALRAGGAEVEGVQVDVSRAEQVEVLAARAFERFGNVHLLVNNAGVALAKSAWETTPADWDWVLGVNLYGVIHGIQAFVPRMLENGEEGHIVNTASVAGLISQPAMAAYNVSKFGVVTLTEGLHHDLTLRQARLKASVLCPGWVRTRIAEAERHRDADQRTDPSQLDPVTAKTGLSMFKAVQQGIAPEPVAEAVFAAVEDGRFYIFTHPETKAGVGVRMEDILRERLPTLLSV
ncbi:MAG: SDR family NAD(P)-dependent oxidoreductase [Candidatus Contendobacter sp.]|nr:SDR family NAD(P)-dependent oxidoreductase [Candidatus Contendobacter sp.]